MLKSDQTDAFLPQSFTVFSLAAIEAQLPNDSGINFLIQYAMNSTTGVVSPKTWHRMSKSVS